MIRFASSSVTRGGATIREVRRAALPVLSTAAKWSGVFMSRRIEEVPFDRIPEEILTFWRRCTQQNNDLTPFHSYEWLRCWADSYAAREDAYLAVAYNGTGTPVSLLPLMRWKGSLRSLSYNASDYTGLIWDGSRINVNDMAQYLLTNTSHMQVVLWNVRALDPLVVALTGESRLELVDRTAVTSMTLPHTRLRPWNQQAPISRRELGRKRRRLDEAGASIRYTRDLDDPSLERAMAIHTAHWARRGESGSFADERRRDFLRRLMRDGPALHCASLWIGTDLLSYRLGPIDDKTYYDWNTGTDPEARRYSPGLVLLDALIARLSMTERVRTIDFLRGEEDYKRAWLTESTWVSTYRCLRA